MSSLERLGFTLLLLIASIVGAYQYGKYEERHAAEVRVLEANAKVSDLQIKLYEESRKVSDEILQNDKAHSDQYANALRNVKPVVVRDCVALPQPPSSPPESEPSGPSERSTDIHLPSGDRDIATAIIMLADRCQRDAGRDQVIGWQKWWDKNKIAITQRVQK